MSGQTESTRVGQLVLARLLVADDKGATGSEIKKALEPLLGHRWAGAALSDRLGQALAELESAGLVTLTRTARAERAALTAEGRRQALETLGVDKLPAKKAWDKIKKTHLAALALGLPRPTGKAGEDFGKDAGFNAALLKSKFGLPLGDFPSIKESLGALCWTLLGFKPGPAFTVQALQTALILREMGDQREPPSRPNPNKEAAKLLAREVGARKSGTDELRLAVIRQWIDGGPTGAAVGAEPAPSPPVVPPVVEALPSLDLGTFARRVVEAARSSASGRFGENKVFIAHVWQGLCDDPTFAAMGPEVFKRRLAEANNARLLDLSRADLVEAMNPEDVRLSEVPYLGATFHFVLI